MANVVGQRADILRVLPENVVHGPETTRLLLLGDPRTKDSWSAMNAGFPLSRVRRTISARMSELVHAGRLVRVSKPRCPPLRVFKCFVPDLMTAGNGYGGPARSCGGTRSKGSKRRSDRLAHLRDIALDLLWSLSHDCGLCGLEIQSPFFADVDHIQPIGDTGLEVIRANLALLHNRCNAVKGKKTMDEAREAVQGNRWFAGTINKFDAESALILYRRASFEIPAKYWREGSDA